MDGVFKLANNFVITGGKSHVAQLTSTNRYTRICVSGGILDIQPVNVTGGVLSIGAGIGPTAVIVFPPTALVVPKGIARKEQGGIVRDCFSVSKLKTTDFEVNRFRCVNTVFDFSRCCRACKAHCNRNHGNKQAECR